MVGAGRPTAGNGNNGVRFGWETPFHSSSVCSGSISPRSSFNQLSLTLVNMTLPGRHGSCQLLLSRGKLDGAPVYLNLVSKATLICLRLAVCMGESEARKIHKNVYSSDRIYVLR